MDHFILPARAVSELLLVFVLGAFVGRALGYWQHYRDMLRRHDMLQRVIVPFEERFRSPLDERKWSAFLSARRSPLPGRSAVPDGAADHPATTLETTL